MSLNNNDEDIKPEWNYKHKHVHVHEKFTSKKGCGVYRV